MRRIFLRYNNIILNEMKNKILNYSIVTVIILYCCGCATVPKESVDLSIELTKMIRSAEKSHLGMLDLFIAERKQRANEYIDSSWTPDFMYDFVNNTHILDTLKYLNSDKQKLYHLKEFSEAAANRISNRRTTMIEAIHKIDNMLRERIEQHYSNMLIVNQTLTAHLQAAVDVDETRRRIMESINIVPQSLLPLDKIGKVIDKMVFFKGEVSEVESFINETKTILKEEYR